jgi:hypothetical protein
MLTPKNLKSKIMINCKELKKPKQSAFKIEPNPSKDKAMHEGDT